MSMMASKTALQLDSLGKSDKEVNKPHQVQFIPADIDFNGVEEVQTYFTNFIKESEDKKCLEVSLRGRPLEGEVLKMPEGYQCLILQAGQGDGVGGAKEEKVLRGIKKVNEITYWNYDKSPSDQDLLKQTLQWLDIAKVMHTED